MSRKGNIGLLIRSLGTGGTETQFVLLVKALKEAGYTPVPIVFYPGGYNHDLLRSQGFEVLSLNKKSRWDNLRPLLRLKSLCTRNEIEVVYSFLVEPNILAVLLKVAMRTPPKIVWGIRASNLEQIQRGNLASATFRIQCSLSRYADAVIFNSHAGKRYHLEKGFPPEISHVIDNFRPEIPAYSGSARARLRQTLGIPDDAVVLGNIGRFDPIKGTASLIEAFGEFQRRAGSQMHLVIVGQGPEALTQEYRQSIDRCFQPDKIHLVDPRDQARAWFSAFDLFVSNSLSEGFPNTLLEALLGGLPVIASNAGDSARIVADSGIIFHTGQQESLISALMKSGQLLPADRRKISESARARFDDRKTLQEIETRLGLTSERDS